MAASNGKQISPRRLCRFLRLSTVCRCASRKCVRRTKRRRRMSDTTVKKIDSKHSPKNKAGQKYLAAGVSVAMRLWENEQPQEEPESHARDYETVGYVISGKA